MFSGSQSEPVESVKWAATIDELRASTPEDSALGVAAGYRDEGDGGGGLFAWNPESDEPVDGGTVFAPVSGGENTGRWERLERRDGVYNVRHFGAHPDREDNAPAFQAALDAAASAHGTVFVPDGMYRTASVLTMHPNTGMLGSEGGRTIIQKTNHSVGPDVRRYNRSYNTHDDYAVDSVLSIDNPGEEAKFAMNVVLQNLRLRGKARYTGEKEDRNQYGVYAPRIYKGHFRNVSVSGVSDGFLFREIIVSSVEDCVATQVGRGFVVPTHETGGGTSTRFNGCYTTRTDRWGYYLKGMSYTTMQGCACDMAGQEDRGGGYFISLGKGISIISCGCESTSAPALYIERSSVSVMGFKTYKVRGSASYSSYLHVKSAAVTFVSCLFDSLIDPKQTRNARILGGSSVAFIHSDRASGGRDNLVDDSSSLTILDQGELRVHEDGGKTEITPDGVNVQDQRVLSHRQPAVGFLEGLDEVDTPGALETLDDDVVPETINANFARLQDSLNKVLRVLGREGHGLTEDGVAEK